MRGIAGLSLRSFNREANLNYRRAWHKGGTYFFTVNCLEDKTWSVPYYSSLKRCLRLASIPASALNLATRCLPQVMPIWFKCFHVLTAP
jgi:hypothetical protein